MNPKSNLSGARNQELQTDDLGPGHLKGEVALELGQGEPAELFLPAALFRSVDTRVPGLPNLRLGPQGDVGHAG